MLGEGQCAAHREQVQRFVDGNQFLKGKVVLANELIVSGDFVLYVSRDALSHIKERHSDPSKPGSTFVDGVDLQGVLAKVIARATTERANGRVKWLGADTGATIGYMGVKLGSPEEVAAMSDYQMPDGKRETVKLATGNRDATCQISVIASELGKLSDGKTALSLITMFPGGTTVGGKEIPLDRGLFAREGMYFVVE